MSQTRRGSLCETITGTAIGFTISLLIYQFVITPLQLPPGWSSSALVTIIFTVVSILRGYALRRLFNKLRLFNER